VAEREAQCLAGGQAVIVHAGEVLGERMPDPQRVEHRARSRPVEQPRLVDHAVDVLRRDDGLVVVILVIKVWVGEGAPLL
jgi:hypothetical protein